MSGLVDWWDRLFSLAPLPLKEYYWAATTIYTGPWFWAAVVAILVAERVRPAVKKQPVFSRSLLEDSIWLNLELAVIVVLLPISATILETLYNNTTGGHTLALMARWPLAMKIGISFVAFDFLEYLHHWIRHKIRFLWHFHVIHHSQRTLNQFTAHRTHVVEYFVIQGIQFVPMFALQLTPLAIMGSGMAIAIYTRLSHANVRTGFGPLGRVFVSPQFHRLHHSIEPRHRDCNFGLIFCLWDRMFGTLYEPAEEYPETGDKDVRFETPRDFSPLAWLRLLGVQLSYPIRRLTRGWVSPIDD